MSVLYKGEHPTLGTPVVVKKLTLKGDPSYRERFRREASLMMELRHENVVGVFDHFREGSGHFLVMEYVDGHSLSELLAREGALTPAEATWLVGQIAAALAHIHSHGVVHRDVKPSNILLSREGTVKLADFGIAFTPGGGEDITSEGTALGTPSFMAPEQLEDARTADERSDIWSLGVCYFELITGRKFVSGPSPAAIREALPEALRSVGMRLPPGLSGVSRRFLRRSLKMRPESRLKDGGAALRLLGGAGRGPIPSRLRQRLEALDNSLSTARKPEPADEKTDRESPASERDDSGRLAAIRSLFSAGREGEQDSFRPAEPVSDTGGHNREKSPGKKVSSRLFFGAGVLLAAAALTLIPGFPARLLARRSQGLLRLELEVPEDVPEYWLEGAEARIYREENGMLRERYRPDLRPGRLPGILRSRRKSLPVGAYRVSWSLGDTVSWQSFRLPSFADRPVDDGEGLLVRENLGEPPVFPLTLHHTVSDAVTRESLESVAGFSFSRLDDDRTALESGGRYRFRFTAPGYRDTEFVMGVSPWRRELRLEAALWPEASVLRIINNAARSAAPRLDGRGRYLDVEADPVYQRIGRLGSGEEKSVVLLPGEYRLSPGFDDDAGMSVILESGTERTVEIFSDDDENLRIR